MIPTIETIIDMLLASECTKEGALTWLQEHLDLERGDLREMFAAHAMQGLLATQANQRTVSRVAGASVCFDHGRTSLMAKASFLVADAMLEARRV